MDAAVEDHAQRGPASIPAAQIPEWMHRNAGSNSFEARHRRLVDLRDVGDGPAQVRDRNGLVYRLECGGGELVLGERQAVLLERPAPLRDDIERVAIVGRKRIAEQRPAGDELPDSG